jgi:hypothetical protein
MAGYSGTPLPQKLGIKPGARLGLLGAPTTFKQTLGALPAGTKTSAKGPFDVLVAFFRERQKLEAEIESMASSINPDGALWIAWPKKASGVKTDVTEDTVRAVALPLGLVDNKVCAVDEVWSGLRLVYRLSERSKVAQSRKTRSSTKQK